MIKNGSLAVFNLGRVSWQATNHLQECIVNSRKKTPQFAKPSVDSSNQHHLLRPDLQSILEIPGLATQDLLLFCEHPPTFTAGIRGKWTPEEQQFLRDLGADTQRSRRGGDITFHGPGQLMVYPIIDLTRFRKQAKCKGVRWFVHTLEETLIQTCAHYGITASRTEHTGVWVNDNKIAAVGLRVAGGITSHGIALNCNTDLSWFDHIVPCGIEGKGVTSVSNELKDVTQSGESTVITPTVAQPVFAEIFDDLVSAGLS
eukprot:m.262597 g.262597  ORF g.262597 m.262597 type:complete len:258 (-) comp46267_c0_seq1:164-937(-)